MAQKPTHKIVSHLACQQGDGDVATTPEPADQRVTARVLSLSPEALLPALRRRVVLVSQSDTNTLRTGSS